MADDGTDTRGTGPEDADPLLVRPFLDGRPGAAETAPTWPAPAGPDPGPDAGPSPPAPPAGPAPPRAGRRRVPVLAGRRRLLVVAGAAAAAVLGLGAAGLAALLPGDDGRRALPIPVGTLPPLPVTTAATPPAGPAPTTPGGDRTTATTTATPSRTTSAPPATRSPGRTPATAAPTTAPPAAVPTTEAPLAAPPASPRTGTISGPGGRCLDLNGAVTVDGNHIQMFDCNASAAQVWTLTPDGTLQVLGKCANAGGDAGVHIVPCDGRTTAQWRAGPDGTLVNLAGEQCLTDPAEGRRNGSAVRVAECAGGDAQEWSLP
jgi:hypothetical protein